MSHTGDELGPPRRTLDTLRLWWVWLLALGGALMAFGTALSRDLPGAALLGAGGAVLGLILTAAAARLFERCAQAQRRAVLHELARDDDVPTLVSGPDGRIASQNDAARAAFGDLVGRPQRDAIARATSAPAAVVDALHAGALSTGRASDAVGGPGGGVRVTARAFGRGEIAWRIGPRPVPRVPAPPGVPCVVLDAQGSIIEASPAFEALAGHVPRRLDDVLDRAEGDIGRGMLHGTGHGVRRVGLVELPGEDGTCAVLLLPEPEPQRDPDWRILDALPVPLLRVATDGTLLSSNTAAEDLLRLEHGTQPNLADLVTGLGRPVSEWLAEAAKRNTTRSEVVRTTRHDHEVFLQISLARVRQAETTSLVAFLNDATELKTLEAQFVQSQKMQAIGQLAGGVAHDFNNLLTAIRGHCDLLLLRRDAGHPDYADLEQINQNANRAAGLVSQLLAFSRKQALQPRLLDLRDTLSDLAHLLNRLVGEKIALEVSHDHAKAQVRADKRQLEQVLMNLVVNARDAMPDGGAIRIATEHRRIDAAFERDRARIPAGDYVVLSVSDEGVGIAPDRLPKIFEPFYTTKRTGEGTGLGLSTAYGIVKQTGGYIFADSVVGSGSIFTIYLPAHDAPADDTADPAAAAVAVPSAMQGDGVVLLVEDEAAVRAFAGRALRLRGFTVIEAENAEEALEKLSDPTLSVDVFVTDVIMPGMDGPSWVARALEDRPGTRVVFVSGYAEDSLADSGRRVPGATFLAKPFSLADLTATVQAQLQTPSPGSSLTHH